MTQPVAGTGPVKSAQRAVAILEFIADRGSANFAEICEQLEFPRSSTHGLLRTLVEAGWLDHSPDTRHYSIGLGAWQVGQRYGGHDTLANGAKPVMDQLRDELGETVQLARLDGVECVYIAISAGPESMRIGSSVGMRLHAHATGIGKAMLSTLPQAEARSRLESVALPRLTPQTLTDVDLLLEELAKTRNRGYALDDEEYIEGCRCVAIPITEGTGGLVSALSITVPYSRTRTQWPERYRRPLDRAVREIRGRLGVRALPVVERQRHTG